MTGIITFEDLGGGRTRYTARARHWTVEDMKKHEEMGFHEGWGKATDQLAEFAVGHGREVLVADGHRDVRDFPAERDEGKVAEVAAVQAVEGADVGALGGAVGVHHLRLARRMLQPCSQAGDGDRLAAEDGVYAYAGGTWRREELPAEFADAAKAARTQLLETVAELDDKLMERYLEDEGANITEPEIRAAVRCTAEHTIQHSGGQGSGGVRRSRRGRRSVPDPLRGALARRRRG